MEFRYETLQALGGVAQRGNSMGVNQAPNVKEAPPLATQGDSLEDYIALEAEPERPASLPEDAAQDLVDFCSSLDPTQEEREARKGAIQRVTDAVRGIWPAASVQVFGSYVTGLYLPTSDLDVVVFNSKEGDVRAALKAVATSLVRKSIAKNVQIIGKAKVPIVKYEDAATGINVDVSFDAANGPQTADFVRRLMARLPPMRALTLVLKLFLHQRELNEVYQGGIGSYALLVMVAAFLLAHPSRGAGSGLEPNLGVLLLDFLRLYGRALNTDHVGVSCRKAGGFFARRERGMPQPERPGMLAVEDPTEPSNDIARASFNAQKVRSAFDFAYQLLTAPSAAGECLLKRVIRLDALLLHRRPQQDSLPGAEHDVEIAGSKRRGQSSNDTPEQEWEDRRPHKRQKATKEGSQQGADSQAGLQSSHLAGTDSGAATKRKLKKGPARGRTGGEARTPTPESATSRPRDGQEDRPKLRLHGNPSLLGKAQVRRANGGSKVRERDMAFE